MSAHTPGPWTVRVRSAYTGNYIVAEAGPSEDEANATLIAAAPELLAALKLAHAEHAKSVLFGSEALRAMEAAIARAEGRS